MSARIVILGGGFGGIRVAQGLRHLALSGEVRVTLIDRESHHLYTPSLYEVVCGNNPRQICLPLAEILKPTGADFLCGVVERLNLRDRTIRLKSGREVGYDHLVIAIGSVVNDYGIPGVAEYAHRLKDACDAWLLRQHLEDELASAKSAAGKEAAARLTFLVAGGGPAGVEISGELAEFVQQLARRQGLNRAQTRIELHQSGPEILPRFARTVAQLARRRLHQLGVKVFTRSAIRKERLGEILVSKGARPAETLIWTAGVKPPPLLDGTKGLTRDRTGRIVVDPFLQTYGRPGVWVVGDCASTSDVGTAYAARRHGAKVALNIARSIEGTDLSPYEPAPPLLVMPIGHNYAIIQFGHQVVSGFLAAVVHRLVDLKYLLSVLPFGRALATFLVRHNPCPDCHVRLSQVLAGR